MLIIASPKILKENPAAVKAFLSAFTKGAKDVIANPAAAIADVKARDGIINVELETRRLQLAIDTVINSPSAREEGFGQVKGPRLALMASQVSDAFNTKTRIKPDDVWKRLLLAKCQRTRHLAQTQEVNSDPDTRRPVLRHSNFVDFQNVWLAYNDELLAAKSLRS